MTELTALEVADLWVAAGGPRSRVTEWTAVALEESGWRTDAVSSVGAIGLYQFMPGTAAEFGYSPGDMYDPRKASRACVLLSGHGTNCAAWDSCYANIYSSGRYSFLGYPERGSNVYGAIPLVAAALGTHKIGGGAPPPVPGVGPDPGPALHAIGSITGKHARMLERRMNHRRMVLQRMYTKGWR